MCYISIQGKGADHIDGRSFFFCTELKEEIGCIGKYYLSVNFPDILGVGASQS